MKWLIFVVALLIGIGIGIAYQKSKATSSPIYVRVGTLTQKALLNPHVGDIIKWQDNSAHPVPPNWTFGQTPCDKNDADKSECIIQASADKKRFAYTCPSADPCDPEVPVGSDVDFSNKIMTTAGLAPSVIYIGCDANNNNSVAVSPTAATVSKTGQTAAAWDGLNGIAWSVGSWTDSGGHAVAVCTETTVNQGQAFCTLSSAAVVGQTYTYQATASSCSPPNGSFTLQINP